jgi:hypothetical protein
VPEPISSSPSSAAIGKWRKASYCNNGECVEVALLAGGRVGLRDSKDPGGGALVLSREQAAALLDGIKAGELDHLT